MLLEMILDIRKCPNQKMHESESAGFPVWELSKVRDQFQNHFSHKVVYNYCSQKNLGALQLVIQK